MKVKTIAALALTLAAFAAPAFAQDGESKSEAKPTSEERFASLEKQIDDLRNELKQAQGKAAAEEGKEQHFTDDEGDPRWGGKKPRWKFGSSKTSDRPKSFEAKLGGYFSVNYRGQFGRDRNQTTRFDQHRLVPQLDFTIAERLKFSTEIEFEGGGADASFLSDNEVLVEYAELSFEIMDELHVKAGLILVPFGRYNLVHDDPLHDLFDRPFVARRIVPSAFDQPGVAIAGDFAFESLGLHYDLAATQGFDDGFSTNGGSRSARQSFREDDNSNKAVWLRVAASPKFENLIGNEDIFATIGFSLNQQRIGGQDFDTTGFGFDWQAKWNPQEHFDGRFTLATEGEYAQIQINRDDAAGVNNLDGYYVQLGFQYRPWDDKAWGGWLRDSGYIGLTLRYEGNDLDDRQDGGSVRDDRQAFTFGIAFRPFLKTVIRSEWKLVNSSDRPDDEADRFVFSISTYF